MNRIKELRKARKKTLDDVTKETGIARTSFNNYETERTTPQPETWQLLADYFGVTVNYLKGFGITRDELVNYLAIAYLGGDFITGGVEFFPLIRNYFFTLDAAMTFSGKLTSGEATPLTLLTKYKYKLQKYPDINSKEQAKLINDCIEQVSKLISKYFSRDVVNNYDFLASLNRDEYARNSRAFASVVKLKLIEALNKTPFKFLNEPSIHEDSKFKLPPSHPLNNKSLEFVLNNVDVINEYKGASILYDDLQALKRLLKFHEPFINLTNKNELLKLVEVEQKNTKQRA